MEIAGVGLRQFQKNAQRRLFLVGGLHLLDEEMGNTVILAQCDERLKISRVLQQVGRFDADFDPKIKIQPVAEIGLRKGSGPAFGVIRRELLLKRIGGARLVLQRGIGRPPGLLRLGTPVGHLCLQMHHENQPADQRQQRRRHASRKKCHKCQIVPSRGTSARRE